MILHGCLRVLRANNSFLPDLQKPINLIPHFSTSTLNGFKCTSVSNRKKNAKRSLLPFRIVEEETEGNLIGNDFHATSEVDLGRKQNILLNPAKYADILNSQRPSAPADARSLRVSVIGVPNAGKSTLVNQLVGVNVCPYSEKVHTTRGNALGTLTKDSTQIVFQVSRNICLM